MTEQVLHATNQIEKGATETPDEHWPEDNWPQFDRNPDAESDTDTENSRRIISHGEGDIHPHADEIENYKGPKSYTGQIHLPDIRPSGASLKIDRTYQHLARCGLLELTPVLPRLLDETSDGNLPTDIIASTEEEWALRVAYRLVESAGALDDTTLDFIDEVLSTHDELFLSDILSGNLPPGLDEKEQEQLKEIAPRLRKSMREQYCARYPKRYIALRPRDSFPPDIQKDCPWDVISQRLGSITGTVMEPTNDSESGIGVPEGRLLRNRSINMLAESISHGQAIRRGILPEEIAGTVYTRCQAIGDREIDSLLNYSIRTLSDALDSIIKKEKEEGEFTTLWPNINIGFNGVPHSGKTSATVSTYKVLTDPNLNLSHQLSTEIRGYSLDLCGPSGFVHIRHLSPEARIEAEKAYKQKIDGKNIPFPLVVEIVERSLRDIDISEPLAEGRQIRDLETLIEESDHRNIPSVALVDSPPLSLREEDLYREDGIDHISLPTLIGVDLVLCIGDFPLAVQKQIECWIPPQSQVTFDAWEGMGAELYNSLGNPTADPTFHKFFSFVLDEIVSAAELKVARCSQVLQDLAKHWIHHEGHLLKAGLDSETVSIFINHCIDIDEGKTELMLDPAFNKWVDAIRQQVQPPPFSAIEDYCISVLKDLFGVEKLSDIPDIRSGLQRNIAEIEHDLEELEQKIFKSDNVSTAQAMMDKHPQVIKAYKGLGIDLENPEQSGALKAMNAALNEARKDLSTFDEFVSGLLKDVSDQSLRVSLTEIILDEISRTSQVIALQKAPSPVLIERARSLNELLELMFHYNDGLHVARDLLLEAARSGTLIPLVDAKVLSNEAGHLRSATSMSDVAAIWNRHPEVISALISFIPAGQNFII